MHRPGTDSTSAMRSAMRRPPSAPTGRPSPRRSARRRSGCARRTARGSFDWRPPTLPAAPPQADASLATEPGLACTVQVADCLPILYADPRGRAVAAAHAGWRGLAGGIAETTLHARLRSGVVRAGRGGGLARRLHRSGALRGRRRRAAGLRRRPAAGRRRPLRRPRRRSIPANGWPTWPGSARDRLLAAGARDIGGGGWCTVERRLTVLLVPPRRRHRAHGRRRLAARLNRQPPQQPPPPAHRAVGAGPAWPAGRARSTAAARRTARR